MTIHLASGFSRRQFLKTSAALGAVALATPVFGQSDVYHVPAGLPAPDGPMRWLDTGGQKGEFHKVNLPAYGKEAGIEVVYDGLPWSEVGTLLPLGIRNGTAPDTFCLPQAMEASVAVAEGWVQPIEDFIPDFQTWKSAFPEGSFIEGINVFEGKTYGYPYGSQRRFENALLFNQDMMNAAGYDNINAERPLTFDEMRDAASKIVKTSGGAFGFIIGGKQLQRWGDVTINLAQRAGAKVGWNRLLAGMDFKTGEYAFGSDPFVVAVELLLAMRDDRSVFPGVLNIIAPQARDFMAQGAAGMILQGPWNVPIWQATAPKFNFGLSPSPSPDQSAFANPVYVANSVNTLNMMWINRQAKNPHHVGGYFHWLGTVEGQVAYANVGSCADPALFPETAGKAKLSSKENAMLKMATDLVRIHPNSFVRNPEVTKVAAAYVDPTPNLSQSVQGLFAGQLSGVKATLQAVADAQNRALDAAIAKAKAGGAKVSREDFIFGNWDPATDYGSTQYKSL